MDLFKIKTVYDETLYVNRDEYRQKMEKGRKFVKIYHSTGRLYTVPLKEKFHPGSPVLLHVENIQEHYRALLAQESHPDFWRVYERSILRANQSTREEAEHYMEPGRVLIPPINRQR